MIEIVDESVRINVYGIEEEKKRCLKSGFCDTIVLVERFIIVRGDLFRVFNLSSKIVSRNFIGVFDERVIFFNKECIIIFYGF